MNDTETSQGLKSHKIEELRRKYGPNKLPTQPVPGIAKLFLQQFLSPFIYMLLAAAIVSFVMGQSTSALFILAVLLLNAFIGMFQEYSAQKAATALRQMVKGQAKVIRDGETQKIEIEEVLPGDVILLSSGDKVPADIQLKTSQNLAIDESMLTGESTAVSKNAEASVQEDAPLSEQLNHCFAGTMVTHGRGRGVVTNIGEQTEIGRIAHQVNKERIAEPPLMVRIRRFTYQVAAAILLAIVFLGGLMFLRGSYGNQEMILMAIGLAVSSIPEGLPAALTVALAIGMQRMAKQNVIIRKLIAVEALGSCTFICSDKTGTLTVNELTIRKAVLPDGQEFEVTGEGVGPGHIKEDKKSDQLQALAITGALANESQLDYSGGEWSSDGDIVDVAFLVFAKKLDLSIHELQERRPQKELIPYESERAFSGSLNESETGHHLHLKGSPEKMLEICTHMRCGEDTEKIDTEAIQAQFEALAGKGYRIIALAQGEACSDQNAESQLQNLTFLGMVAMIDPLRPEAFDAVKRCRQGGIGVAMITGDHPETARAIALELGLCEKDDDIVTGPQLSEAKEKGQKAIADIVRPARVFARIEPQQKEQIVETLQAEGHFVAVTGDGVNDAPAMRAANAGIAMGKRGTDVARETADLILSDDNFASIVAGIDQGRIVYNNIRKVITLLITTGFSAILLFFLSAIAGLPMPLIAVQLLWLNLVANGLQDVALAFEPKEGGELRQKPRHPKEPIFERRLVEHMIIIGSTMGGLAFSAFYYFNLQGYALEECRNLTLMLLVLFGNIHALSSRSETRSLFSMNLLSNPFLICAVPLAQFLHIGASYLPGLRDVLQLRPITLEEWLPLLIIALMLLLVEELHKTWIRKYQN